MATATLSSNPIPQDQVLVALKNMEGQLLRMRRGEITNNEFRPSRTILAVYGQRQPEEYMVRVRIPYGGLTARQLRTLAKIVAQYGNGASHVTTRQNMQLHWLKVDQTPDLLRMLLDVGLTTLQAGGNSVRTVAACPLAGVCSQEAFDVTPYAQALDAHYLGNKDVLGLPRKFKASFSGCPQDCAYTAIQDFGAIAQVKMENGVAKKGFRIVAAGGLGVFPRLAQTLEEFVPEEDLVPTCDALLHVFDRMGERANKQKARLKFLVNRMGTEEFRRIVRQERKTLTTSSDHVPSANTQETWLPVPPSISPSRAPVRSTHYQRWLAWNVQKQEQPGRFAVFAPLPQGDITARQMEAVARMAERYGSGRVRTTQQQNLVVRDVSRERLPTVYAALKRAGLTQMRASGIADVTTCPGTSACALGIVGAKALATHLSQMLAERGYQEDDALGGLRIKVSGCPDSCGHQYLADIGLYGSALHHDGRLYPAFQLLLGGAVSAKGTRFARPVVKVPARRVPQAVETILGMYRSQRQADEPFTAFVDRMGLDAFRRELAAYTQPPTAEQDPAFYTDWDATSMYILQRGEGECSV